MQLKSRLCSYTNITMYFHIQLVYETLVTMLLPMATVPLIFLLETNCSFQSCKQKKLPKSAWGAGYHHCKKRLKTQILVQLLIKNLLNWSSDKNSSLIYQRLLTDNNSEEYLPCDLSPSLGSKPFHLHLIKSIYLS